MSSAPGVLAHHERPRWQWWVVIILTPIALVAGTIGFYQYDLEHLGRASRLTSLYHAAQMFILHTPHLEGDASGWLHAGRWLAAAVFGIAAVSTLYYVFAAEWQLFRLWFTRDHVVVCGLGKLGTLLAVELKKAGHRVVAIEASATAEGVQQARNHGITVMIGNACSAQMLARARVPRASRVFAVCSDEQSNVGIAALAGGLIASPRSISPESTSARQGAAVSPSSDAGASLRRRVECWLFVTDAKLRATLRRKHRFRGEDSRYRVNVRGLDLFAVAARKALQEYSLDHRPVDRGTETRVHIVLVGFGEMGQALALQAARIGHFANGTAWPDGKKLKVTLVDRRIGQRWPGFAAEYPAYQRICEVDCKPWTPDDPDFVDNLVGLCPAGGPREEVLTFALCVDKQARPGLGAGTENPLGGDDAVNLSLALELAPLVSTKGAQVLVQVGERCGFGSLFDAVTRSPSLEGNLHAFGIMEDLCSSAVLVDEEQDRLARAIHDRYRRDLERRRQAGEAIPPKPADVPWEVLDESFKDSNRQVADHIRVKLRALGYHDESIRAGRPADIAASQDDVELLARMEHARWCAEKWLDGWTFGDPRDDPAKRHPDLRSWEKLPESERRIDRAIVTGIAEALAEIGKAAYR